MLYGTISFYFYSHVMWRNEKHSITRFHRNRRSSLKWGGTWLTLIGWWFILKYFNLSISSKELQRLRLNAPDGLWWTHGDISSVDSRSDKRNRTTLFLHARRDKIWEVYLWSNKRDLMAMIHIQAFHLSRLLKIKSQILWSCLNFSIN